MKVELHAHPFLENYSIESIINAMQTNRISITALEALDRPIFDSVNKTAEKELRQKGYVVEQDSTAICISKNNSDYYILRALEISTKENYHFLIIGEDNIQTSQQARTIIDLALSKDSLVIFDHPLVDNDYVGCSISKAKERELEELCKEYSCNLALEWNSYCIPWVRNLLSFNNNHINQRIIDLSQKLRQQGYNCPVVTDTDLHARKKQHLKMLGRAAIKININTDSGKSIISSLKQNIFSENYENTCNYVPFTHLVKAFGIPYVFKLPRSRAE